MDRTEFSSRGGYSSDRTMQMNERETSTLAPIHTSIHGMSSTSSSDTHPLSPESRVHLFSEATRRNLADSETSSRMMESITSTSTRTNDNPLSPHSTLMKKLNMYQSSSSTNQQYMTGSQTSSSHGMAPTYTPSVSSISSIDPPHVSRTVSNPTELIPQDRKRDASSCGADLWFSTSIVRIRMNNHQCLHVTMDNIINVDGNGLEDTNQVFMLVNAMNRLDQDHVYYSNTVAFQCMEGTRKGWFLSMDPSTHQLFLKKVQILSNTEKWKVINPSIPLDEREERQLFNETYDSTRVREPSVKSLWQRERMICTSDPVLIKAFQLDLFLSVQRDANDPMQFRVMLQRESLVGSKTSYGTLVTQVWELTKSNLPYDPTWNRQREYLTHQACLKRKEEDSSLLAPLSTFPPSVQEQIMMDDLLYSFLGIEGKYIKLKVTETITALSHLHRSFQFSILNQHGMDPSLSTLVARCVPLGEYYLKIVFYTEQYSQYQYGQVHHAFCAALKTLLKEYKVMIGQLEYHMKQREFSMQSLWCCIQPTFRTMEMLNPLIDSCRHIEGGGALLSAIQRMKASLAGDVKARQVFTFLMQQTSVPYLKMVESWIYDGEIVDCYDEFMIRSDEQLNYKDLKENLYSTYWEDRFTLRESQVPLFLTRHANKILATGKYLHIFRTVHPQTLAMDNTKQTIVFSESESDYEELIDRAYEYASAKLLSFFVYEYDLSNRFKSLKHYFLMDQGDFFVDFMEAAEKEMHTEASKISISKLESLLHMSLQTSTCAPDVYRDDLSCFLSPTSLISQLIAIHEQGTTTTRRDTVMSTTIGFPVVEAFNLDFNIQWPLSLIISCGELTKYQMLFRHLFYCKYVEKQLGDAWLNHQAIKEFKVRGEFGRSFCLRQRMLHFQQNLLYYMMIEVISPKWHEFQTQLESIETIDGILEIHRIFLDQCLKECLLSDPELLRCIYLCMKHCLTFVDHIEMVIKPYLMDEEQIKKEREDQRDLRAEKKARDETDAALLRGWHRGRKQKGTIPVLKRRQSSHMDMRRARINAVSEDLRQTVTITDGPTSNLFRKRTLDLEHAFDSLVRDLIHQLIRRSRMQHDAHLSNLCTRLDYNGYYTSGNH